jgi:hypothetical protein
MFDSQCCQSEVKEECECMFSSIVCHKNRLVNIIILKCEFEYGSLKSNMLVLLWSGNFKFILILQFPPYSVKLINLKVNKNS